ncbi:MAG: AraC family transcriptional regulator [Synergistaceae bacterium]|nr:AraC family transcriptional regulator [Synergistaceae bacterium]
MLRPKYELRFNSDDTWQMHRLHFHEDVEVLLSLSSSGDFFIENELYPLQRGALFLLREATLHKSVAESPYKRYVLHISPETLQEFSTPQSDLVAFTRKVAGRNRQLTECQIDALTEMFQRLEKPFGKSFCGDIRRSAQLLDFLTTLFPLFEDAGSENAETGRGRNANSDFARIAPLIRYIPANIAESLSLDRLASQIFVSKYHMCRIFKSATGFSVTEYIIHCRVLKARELLRQGLHVQEVAERVGFHSNAHFIRTFGALTGTSPKRYAREYLLSDKA